MSVPQNKLLQLLQSGINQTLERTSGGPSTYLTPEEQSAVDRQRRMAMAQSLLQSAAPRPQGTGNVFGDLGAALGAGREAQGAGLDNALKARLLQAQMARYNAQPGAALSDSGKKINELEQSLGRRLTDKERFTLMGASELYKEPAPAQPTEASKKATELEQALGRPLNERERATLFGLGDLYKPAAADEADKPLSATDLARLRAPDGSQFPFGTTGKQAAAAGAKTVSEAELTRQSSMSGALNTLGELKNLALGEGGAFRDNGGSVLSNNVLARFANGISNGIGAFLGTEASQRREVYNSTSQGSISSLIKSMGEAGSLSDGDVKRALALVPALGATPDTAQVAQAKLDELQKIISRGGAGLGAGGNEPADPLGIR